MLTWTITVGPEHERAFRLALASLRNDQQTLARYGKQDTGLALAADDLEEVLERIRSARPGLEVVR